MFNRKKLYNSFFCKDFNFIINLEFTEFLWVDDFLKIILFPYITDYKKSIILLKNDHLVLKSEYNNFKKRSSEDLSKAYKYSIESFFEDLLPILDSLESALLDKTGNTEKVLEGIRLIIKLFSNIFDKNGVNFILPKIKDSFDPHKHMAISTVNFLKENNIIFNVLQKGYSLYERIIRPALVVVNKV
ncbi:Heat shock protein GrpE [Candidatus Nasuia deltocephalinicola]|nr:Heat shock protein GrpE [Candidatus Nasuia deltocephalinicola]